MSLRDDDAPDARLLQALALLQSCLAERGASASAPGDDWLESSTDVLTPWHPERAALTPAWPAWPGTAPHASAWDAYFRAPHAEAPATLTEPPTRAADTLAEADAEAAVDALYGFVHGLGRGDVEAALAHVSSDYHVLEGEREVTRDGLRQQLERLLEPLRDARLQVSLARIPEPLPHALGALVRASLQFDWHHGTARPESRVWARVAVLRRERDGAWRLLALPDAGA